MRLGGPVFEQFDGPEAWVHAVRRAGYSAAYAPVGPESEEGAVTRYVRAAQAADIVIAEVGAWSNPISPDSATARAAVSECQRHLDLAERLEARCCVNITGSRNSDQWDGPHPENFSRDTFDLIVQTVREIVDAVRPKRTFYTLETMPWIFPSSPDEYLGLLKAIDRPSVAVHLDPVNLINTPERAYRSGDFLRECFAKLGSFIKSCHAKDIVLQPRLTVHLDECRPGTGVLDYAVFLGELGKLPADTPLLLEHLPESEYPPAAAHIRRVAAQLDFPLK